MGVDLTLAVRDEEQNRLVIFELNRRSSLWGWFSELETLPTPDVSNFSLVEYFYEPSRRRSLPSVLSSRRYSFGSSKTMPARDAYGQEVDWVRFVDVKAIWELNRDDLFSESSLSFENFVSLISDEDSLVGLYWA